MTAYIIHADRVACDHGDMQRVPSHDEFRRTKSWKIDALIDQIEIMQDHYESSWFHSKQWALCLSRDDDECSEYHLSQSNERFKLAGLYRDGAVRLIMEEL